MNPEPPKAKPFQNCKPRSQWRSPRRKLRRMEEVQFGVDKEGHPVLKLVEFWLKPDGLHIRLKHARKKSVMTYHQLANGVGGGQMNLI